MHDLLGAALGAAAAGVLLSLPWQVDTSGPTPFYKGPLLYPLLVLSLMVLAALPATLRLALPPAGASWHLDGGGYPRKPAVIFAMLAGFLAALVYVGLEIASLGFLAGSLYYLGHRRPATLVLVPVVVTALVAIVFKHLLLVWFPAPVLWDLWMG